MDPDAARDGLSGLTVVALESRRAVELTRLLQHRGATVMSAPALREIPISENRAAIEFADELEQGRIDALILLTGVGTRALVDAVADTCPRERLVVRLATIPIVARGPKPVAALRELGLTPTVRVPEPNTWRELLESLDRELPVAGLRVAVQEYGKSNPALITGLEQRGANVVRVPVYRWALPEDLEPLHAAIRAVLDGGADVIVFTTAVQVDHLLQVAGDAGQALVQALGSRVVVASIGPTASEALAERGIATDIAPEHPKMGPLVAAIAARAAALVARKREGG